MRALPGRAARSSIATPAPTRGATAQVQRERIRRAAGELIAKRGYGGVTVELIVKRAHVSFKTFYNQYSNKHECFLDLFDSVTDQLQGRVRAELAAASPTWPAQVALALRIFSQEVEADPLIARACIVEAPTAGRLLLERYESATKAFVPLLRAGRRHNPLAADLPETLEETLSGAIIWSAYERLMLGEPERLAELLPETVEFVLRPYIGNAEARRALAAIDES